MSKLKVFSIWCDPDGDLTLVQGTDPPTFVHGDEQVPGCVMVHRFEAEGLGEAAEVLHRWQDQSDGQVTT